MAKTYAALAAAVVFWGSSFVATKLVLRTFTPEAYMLVRFALASLAFVIVLWVRGFPRLPGVVHARLALIALLEPGLYFVFETNGLALTTAPKASLIIATTPIVVALLSRAFLGERMTRRVALGGIVSFAGIVLLVVSDLRAGALVEGAGLGDLLVLGAVFSAAGYIILTRSLSARLDSVQLTAYQVIYGTVVFLPLFLVRPSLPEPGTVGLQAIGALLFLAVFATVVAFLSYNYALSQIPAARAGVFLNVIPLVTALVAWPVLGEVLTPVQAVGGALVLMGMTYANRRRRPAVAPLEG
ncbi:MAG: DMT family transporter [Spirochaetaceae bacterium]